MSCFYFVRKRENKLKICAVFKHYVVDHKLYSQKSAFLNAFIATA